MTTSGWQVEVTPYIWALGIFGTTGLQGRSVGVDVTFRDIVEHLKAFFMSSLGARYRRWSVGMDVNYLKVEDRSIKPPPPASNADYIAEQLMMEVQVRYRVLQTAPVAADLLVGGRRWVLDNSVRLSLDEQPIPDLKLNEKWTDPFVGARASIDLSPRLLLQLHGDVGGFRAGSRFSWQALGTVGYKISSRWTIRGGYRDVDVDFDNGHEDFFYDVGYRGRSRVRPTASNGERSTRGGRATRRR